MRDVGLEIIIVGGRYFAYSYCRRLAEIPNPVHLIVDKIPLDPEQYRGTVPIHNSG
jgi:Trk K+ transport system NAD-binding subunit